MRLPDKIEIIFYRCRYPLGTILLLLGMAYLPALIVIGIYILGSKTVFLQHQVSQCIVLVLQNAFRNTTITGAECSVFDVILISLILMESIIIPIFRTVFEVTRFTGNEGNPPVFCFIIVDFGFCLNSAHAFVGVFLAIHLLQSFGSIQARKNASCSGVLYFLIHFIALPQATRTSW